LKIIAGTIKGQSSETKPTAYRIGTRFEELDTGRIYLYDGNIWQYCCQTEEAKNYFAKQNNGQGSPFIRLTGDEFARNAESSLYLLENLNSAIGGGALTNNNGVTFVEESNLPLRGYTVANFVASSSQYLSRATEPQFEVGTDSFIAKIDFQTSTDADMGIFSYGQEGAGEQYWNVRYDSSNDRLIATIHDGTNLAQAVGTTNEMKNKILDNKPHSLILLVDRTLNKMFLFLDGQLIASNNNISSVTGTLNNVGENFVIGARTITNIPSQFWNGKLANFHLIKAADYNAIAVLNQGIREAVNSGIYTLETNANVRLNNLITGPNADGSYVTTVIDGEEGEYDIHTITIDEASSGITKILIDNVVVHTKDQYSAVTTNNVLAKTLRVKLGVGKHILKLKTDGKNPSSSGFVSKLAWINIIKRNGHEEGGCTEFLLLGDEINQRSNVAWTFSRQSDYYGNRISSQTNGDYTEGELYLKGGLWNIEVLVREDTTNAGKIDLDFGNVEVLDQQVTNASVNTAIYSRNVRLQQGKQNIRLAVVTGTGIPTIRVAAIRGVRKSD